MCGRRIELAVDSGGARLDRFLAQQTANLSRSAIQRLIDAGQVTVNGEPVKTSYKVRPGDLVVAWVPQPEQVGPAAEAIPLDIVYEDQALIVVNKPAGMVIHPAPGHQRGTLVNALLAHLPDLAATGEGAGNARPGIVHRLDRDTSGLVLVAKNEQVRRALQRQFKARQVHKVYVALLEGRLQAARGRIEAPLGRDPRHRQRMAVVPGGREAITEYRLLSSYAGGDYSLVEAEPKTGRTHQIRVHFASIGHPVVGDPVYGRRRTRLPTPRQFLHAQRLGFTHPLTGQPLEFEAPLPDDLAAVLRSLEQ
ncbi:MAG: RluA family pseudouridine synthase [Anaerolineae bacterium]|nr:RluA family pseudouridine synthase [Anaerolineae bacterium]